ncbi:uncharacterized protein ACRADG_012927 [Cochliomyia hominivorax]
MKLLIIGFAFVALACAQYAPNSEYLPPIQEVSQNLELDSPSNQYLSPAVDDQTILANDGYRYKTVRRQRKRRDVSEFTQYLPPTQEASIELAAPSNQYFAPAVEEQTVLADDGYRYKTVRRQRKRRDVSELTQYLPPTQEASIEVAIPSNQYLAPAVEEQTVLADDGYRYKTVRRQRKRRDVSELTQYLPPTQEASIELAAPSNQYFAPAVEEQTVLADDGYRYKTVRRQRKRRDVNELTQYLPPTYEASIEVAAPSSQYLAPAVEEQTVLADDGYRYKTVRRQRKRRDVSELTQYLPPTQEAPIEVAVPSNQYLAPAVEEQTVLADDGYRYKTVRRQRKRRDVSELTQYLPPTQEASIEVAIPSNQYLAPAVEEQTVLADDGYRYKTVRRQRKRRDVSELTQYLPPTQEVAFEVPAPSNEYLAPAVELQQTVLANDGYRYKTVKKFKVHHVYISIVRKCFDYQSFSNFTRCKIISEMKPILVLLTLAATAYAALPSSEYLPPLEDTSPTSNIDLQSLSDSSALADDGYRYKTVKRLRLRHRRDVSDLPSGEYLPPTQLAPAVADIPVVADVPVETEQETAVLADDGYRYKTVKRIRYRHRRNVNKLPSNEYLPPVQEASVVEEAAPVVATVPEETAVLTDDGYRYKTVKRIRYRRRRDVNELSSNEYLPPVQEVPVVEEAAPVVAVAPEESAVLADDGYRYKTVKRIRYRRRRDVNELPSNEYLPPVQETPVVEEATPILAAAPEESAVLADDGYRYKTVKRIRYRRRRDVNELPSNEYLPPVQEAPLVEEAASVVAAAPEESAVLADDGYRYKTVKRIRYRRRRDVNELPSNEYLPPTQETEALEEASPVVESASLADDGYRYKTVKRVVYRRRV